MHFNLSLQSCIRVGQVLILTHQCVTLPAILRPPPFVALSLSVQLGSLLVKILPLKRHGSNKHLLQIVQNGVRIIATLEASTVVDEVLLRSSFKG